MTFLDFLPCLEALAVIAILPIALVLLVGYFGKRKRDRLASWRATGLSPETATWQALWAWDALAGEYRGRRLTMYWGSFVDHLLGFLLEREERRTRVRVVVRPPTRMRLTIKPKGDREIGVSLGKREASQAYEIYDQFSIQSDPPDLAARVLAVPRISALLVSDPKPAIELKGSQLQFERAGYFPDLQDAIPVFDTLCDLAGMIEQVGGAPFPR